MPKDRRRELFGVKICAWYKTTDGPWGGGNQFVRALVRELRRTGHDVRDEPRGDEDVVMLNAFLKGPGAPLRPNEIEYVRRVGPRHVWSRFVPQPVSRLVPRRGTTFVHRLDGVQHLIRGTVTDADNIHVAVNGLCDYTIFQSEYCVSSFRECGGIDQQRSTIIYNGVDGEIFTAPKQPSVSTPRVLRFGASSWSPNPRKGFARLAALSQVPGVEVEFAGRWPETVPVENVTLVGPKASPELSEWLHTRDAFVHAAEKEPCSNAILEGLATGLPVLYLDSGGSRELAANYGLPLGDDLAQTVAEFRELYPTLRQRVLADRRKFLIDGIAPLYVAAFETAIRLRRSET
ncbi:MAG TPA: glycosyltransferase family 4 protein [Thermoanaerobaculia bacterium]